MGFKIGDKVKINMNADYSSQYSFRFPNNSTIHGVSPKITTIGEIIAMDNWNEVALVKYTETGATMQLGFKFGCLILDPYGKELMEDKMELKELSKDNLKEAMSQYKDEKMNAEVEFAKKKLRELNDKKDLLLREIKAKQDDVDKINEELKVFK